MKKILFVLLAILLLASCGGDNPTPPQEENPTVDGGTGTPGTGGGTSTPDANVVTLEGFKIPTNVVEYTYGTGTFDMTGRTSVMLKCTESIGTVKFTGLDESRIYGVIRIKDGYCAPIVEENGVWSAFIDAAECYICPLPEYSIGTVVQAPESSEYKCYGSSNCTYFCYRVKASDVSFADKSKLVRVATRASEDVSFTVNSYIDGKSTSILVDLESGNELIIICMATWDEGKNTGTYQINLREQTQLAIGQSTTLAHQGAYRIPASEQELILEIAETKPNLYRTAYVGEDNCRLFLIGNDGATSRYYVDRIGSERVFSYTRSGLSDDLVDGIKLRTITDSDKAEILYLDFVSDGNGGYTATVTKEELESHVALNSFENQNLVFVFNFPQDTVLDSSITVNINTTDFTFDHIRSSMNCITPDGEINATWLYGMPVSGYMEFTAYNETLPDTAQLTFSVKLTY